MDQPQGYASFVLGLIVMLGGFAGVFVLIGLGVIQAAQLRKLG